MRASNPKRLRLGAPIYLTPGEAVESAKANDGQQDRAWNLWKRAIMFCRFSRV